MAEIIRRGVEGVLATAEPARDDLWESAAWLIGGFQDVAGADDVSARHDAYLDESFG